MYGSKRVLVRDLNPHILCALCGGYLIQATTVIECLHSFCRSCIVNFLETSKVCPICDAQIHKTRPLLNIRPDQTLQSLVYKLVPGLFQDEMRRRREFHESLSESDLEDLTLEERGEAKLENEFRQGDDHVSLVLQMVFRKDGRKSFKVKDTRYLLCPSEVTIRLLKRFIRRKFDLGENFKIEMYQAGEELTDDLMLQDVSLIYSWRGDKPMCICYTVCEEPVKPMKSLPCSNHPSHTVSSVAQKSDIPVQEVLTSQTVAIKNKSVVSGQKLLSSEKTSAADSHVVNTTLAASPPVNLNKPAVNPADISTPVLSHLVCTTPASLHSPADSHIETIQSATSHSVTDIPASGHALTDIPALSHSVTGIPALSHSVTDIPASGHAVTDIPASSHSSAPVVGQSLITAPATCHSFTTKSPKGNSLSTTPATNHLVTTSPAVSHLVTITPSTVKSHSKAISTSSVLSSEDCIKTLPKTSLKKSNAVVNKMTSDKLPSAKPPSLPVHVQDMVPSAPTVSVNSDKTPASGNKISDSTVSQPGEKVTHLLHSVHSILNKGRKKSQERNEKSAPLSWKPLQDPNTLTSSPDNSGSLNVENNKVIRDKCQVMTCDISLLRESEKQDSLHTSKEVTKSSRNESPDKCWSLDKFPSKTKSKSSRKSVHSDTPGLSVKTDTARCTAESFNSCQLSHLIKSSHDSHPSGHRSSKNDSVTSRRSCHDGNISCIGSETPDTSTSQVSAGVPSTKVSPSVHDDIIFTSYIPEYHRHSKLPSIKRSVSCEVHSPFPEPDLSRNKSLGVTLEKRNWKKRKLSTMEIDWPGSAGLPVAGGSSNDVKESSKSKLTGHQLMTSYNDPYHFHVTSDACKTTELSPGRRLMSLDHIGSPSSTHQTILSSPFVNSSFGHVVFSPPQKDFTSKSPRYEVGTKGQNDHAAMLVANGHAKVKDKLGHDAVVKSLTTHQYSGSYTSGGESRSPSNLSLNKTHHNKLCKKGRGTAEDKIGKSRHTNKSTIRSLEEITVDISSSPSDVSSVTSPATDVTSPGTEDRTDTSALPDMTTSCDAGCVVSGYQSKVVPLDLSSKRKI